MTEDQEKHFHSTEVWVRSQKNFIENIQLTLDNSKRMVKNHQDLIAINEPEIPYETDFLENGKKNFREWCEQNELAIPDWAK